MIPGRGASTTCVRSTSRATQKHESAPDVCSSVGEGEASAREAAVPEAVSQCGDSEWKLVVSKRQRWKAASLHKQEWSCGLAADREGKVLAVTAAKFLKFASPLTAVVSQKETGIDSGRSESASSTVSGSKLEGQAVASQDAICDSSVKVQHKASRQNKDCLVVATAECRPVMNGAPNEVTVCKCCRPGTMKDGGQITTNPGTEAGDLNKAGCIASTRRRCCEAALTSRCRPASSDAQAVCEGAPSPFPNHPDWAPNVFAFKKANREAEEKKCDRYERTLKRKRCSASNHGSAAHTRCVVAAYAAYASRDKANAEAESDGDAVASTLFLGDIEPDPTESDGDAVASTLFLGDIEPDPTESDGDAVASTLFLGDIEPDPTESDGNAVASTLFLGDIEPDPTD
ncbi:hypothetical protein HPB49_004891 [Dermacentor silvarum]|uniref:Uncharacterized protein n=1 Tax=Dermacentor silvarum TaxID=543639 RepID=A0ACB8DUS6_DERSI|nr:hypothetical protein HPB49_004891 [Dermacentor silvarum]